VTVSGATSRAAAGRQVELELSTPRVPHSYPGWRTLSSATVGSTGTFSLTAPLHESGDLRVVGGPASVPAPALARRQPAFGTTGVTGVVADRTVATIEPSIARQVTVAPELKIKSESTSLIGGQAAYVRGYLEPGHRGRRVWIQAMEHGKWTTLGGARTGRYGGYTVNFHPGPGLSLRVQFAGDSQNTPTTLAAGKTAVLEPTVASWYYDAGGTACGFHAYYGVANLSLPCGTKVTMSSGGHTLVATVDDRGPYVGGRVFDLNQNVAAALGFSGVGTIYTSIQ
jgi:rare lipoprotein A